MVCLLLKIEDSESKGVAQVTSLATTLGNMSCQLCLGMSAVEALLSGWSVHVLNNKGSTACE
jgi:hypothetical protein